MIVYFIGEKKKDTMNATFGEEKKLNCSIDVGYNGNLYYELDVPKILIDFLFCIAVFIAFCIGLFKKWQERKRAMENELGWRGGPYPREMDNNSF